MKRRNRISDARLEASKPQDITIEFHKNWKYLQLNMLGCFDIDSIRPDYDDEFWETIDLPHVQQNRTGRSAYASIMISHCYRKKFSIDLKEHADSDVYLQFKLQDEKLSKNDDDLMRIPSISIWINEHELYINNLHEPINLAEYLQETEDNVLLIHSKQGHRLRLRPILTIPNRIVGQYTTRNIHDRESRRPSVLNYSVVYNSRSGRINCKMDSLVEDVDGINKQSTGELGKSIKKPEKTTTEIEDVDENDNEVDEKSNECTDHNEDIMGIFDYEANTYSQKIDGPIPRIAILMLIVGTRGDVQPFLALAKELLKYGHRIRLATHKNFREFVQNNGVEFYPLAGDPADLMSFMVKNAGIFPSVSSMLAGDIGRNKNIMRAILKSCWDACIKPDEETGLPFLAEAIIANPPSAGHIHCAEKLKIPLHMIFTMPWTPTAEYPHPFCKIDYNKTPNHSINLASYGLIDFFTATGLHGIINDFRKNDLQMSTLSVNEISNHLIDASVPFTYCWSPSLAKRPSDWPMNNNLSGFFFLDLASKYEPPSDLVDFLQAGSPPIYIGFGSITGHDSKRILKALLSALQTTNYRALLLGFKVDEKNMNDNLFLLENVPHDWLFERVAAVCHHGGAGTTAAGLRAGKPTIVVPFFGDQFFWGAMIAKAGAGPVPIAGKDISAKNFVDAFHFVHKESVREAAMKIRAQFENENGCERAVRLFHSYLPLRRMRSDLESSFVAHYSLPKYNLQVSIPIAQILVDGCGLDESEFTLHTISLWSDRNYGKRFVDFTEHLPKYRERLEDSTTHRKKKNNGNPDKKVANEASEKPYFLDSFHKCLLLYGEIEKRWIAPEESPPLDTATVPKTIFYGLRLLKVLPVLKSNRSKVIDVPNGAVITKVDLERGRSRQKDEFIEINQRRRSKISVKIVTRPKSLSRSLSYSKTSSISSRVYANTCYTNEICDAIMNMFKSMRG